MNDLLVGGCAVGGAVIGMFVDVVAARVPPAPTAKDPEGPLAAIGEAPESKEDEDLVEEPKPPRSLVPSSVEVSVSGVVLAVLFGLAANRFGATPALAPYCVLFAGGLGLSVVDLRVGLVPRKILYPTLGLMVLGLVIASVLNSHWRDLANAGIGGGVAFLLFFALWWFYPSGMGFGDVRLAGLIGIGMGWIGLLDVYIGFMVAFIVGSLVGLAIMIVKGTGRKTRLPFAPALVVGTVVSVLWGTQLINAWFVKGG